MIRILSLLLALVPVARASIEAAFYTTCTVPNITTHYVSSPDTRGTLDILWSCLFTIIACTLTIQHLNIPEQREGRDPGYLGDLKWAAKDTLRSLKWMLITVLAPEMMIGKVWGDRVTAKRIHKKLLDHAESDGVPWTMTHTLFANMGGFVIRSNQGGITAELKAVGEGESAAGAETAAEPGLVQNSNTPETRLLTNTSFIGQTATANTSPSELSSSPIPNPYHLLAGDILKLRNAGQLPRFPRITQDEISDKSKASAFIKLIALIQISWIVIQILVRTGRKLAVTQLEISVLAFAVCAIFIYALNWQKPKDIKAPYTILSFPGGISTETIRALNIPTNGPNTYPVGLLVSRSLGLGRKGITVGSPIPNDYINEISLDSGDVSSFFFLGLFLGCVAFGGIHIAAWDFSFPTKIELILWRVACIWCTVFTFFVLLVVGVVSEIAERCFGDNDSRIEDWWDVFLRLLVCLYIIGRLILLVEIFRTLFFLPTDAFITTSATNIPHVA
jgi:hypothetical protein